MKKLIPLFLILMAYSAFSQSLHVFDVDTTDFPIMRAKFYATDASGNQITNINESDFKITEDGEERNILSVSCPSPKDPEAISSVLTIDVSGSMNGNSIKLAKETAKGWVNGLPLGKSECAITSFTRTNQYLQDFTTNRSRLLEKISGMFVGGGTDFDAAFIDPIAGGLLTLEKAKHKKVMVLITDGYASGNEKQILSRAQSIGATVYCVTLGYKCPDILKNVAEQTGGMWFENVTTEDNVIDVCRNILNNVQDIEPCEIEWESNYSCLQLNITNFNLISHSANNRLTHKLLPGQTSNLNIFPYNIKFLNIEPGTAKDTVITITARNADFTIKNITSAHEDFNITPKSFELEKGESKDITLTFTPQEKNHLFTKIIIETNRCDKDFYTSTYYSKPIDDNNTLKLLSPNGGETFVVGSDSIITWEGVLPSDTVTLEFSSDDGDTWELISNSATGLSYNWKNIPQSISNKCRIRIKNNTSQTMQHSLSSGHTESVSHVSWSPDGTMFATSSVDGTGKIWDAATGVLIHSLEGHQGNINHISWSPDGTKLTTASNDKTSKIWDAATGVLIHSLEGHQSNINHISWSPDGTKLATSSDDKTGKIWDAVTGILIHSLEGHQSNINHISWSPDGSMLATASDDKAGKIWDAATGVLIHSLEGHQSNINHISWSPDGTKLATASDDKTGRIWDVATGALIYSLEGHQYNINRISWSPDGTKLATASDDRSGIIWNAISGKQIHLLKGHVSYIKHICWSPDGTKLATASWDSTGRIWDVSNGKLLNSLEGHNDFVHHISWSPDGSKVISASRDCSIKIWNAYSGILLQTILRHDSRLRHIAWSPDGSKVATGAENKAIIWNANSMASLHSLDGHKNGVYYISWSPDGSKVATASSYDGTGKIWDALSGKLLLSLDQHDGYVTHISWSPDGTKVGTASNDKTAKIWDSNTGKLLQTLVNQEGFVYQITWSPNGSKFATHSFKKIQIWDDENGQLLHTLQGKHGIAAHMAWSPDGSKIAAGSYTCGQIWDADTGLLLHVLEGIEDGEMYMSWSPDGSKIATASNDDTGYKFVGKIWDASDGTLIRSLTGHSERIVNICWSPDGSKLATSSRDNTGKIWDAETGEILSNLDAHKDWLTHIAWNLYGTKVVTSSYDKSAMIWDLSGLYNINQTDTSDATFSIVAPEISSQDIKMGDVVVNSSKDSVITEFIENIGQWDCRIDSIYFKGADADYFKLNGPTPVYTVEMGESMMSEFKFSPTEVRDYSAQLVVITQADTLYQNIRGRGVEKLIAANSGIIDLGIRDMYDYVDSTVVCLENVSNNPIDITKIEMLGPDKKQFLFVNPAEASPLTLPANTPHSLALRFNPKYIGRTSGQIAFHYNGAGSPAIVQLYGAGIGAELNATSDSAHVGDIIGIEIRLTNNNIEKFAEIIGSFEGVIRVENSILGTLYKEDLVKVEADSAFIRFKGEINPESNIIATIPLKVALGRVEYSSIDFEYVKWFDTEGNELVYDTEFTSGFFKLLGIYEQGGKRLYNPEGLVGITSLSPNPAEDKLQLEVNLIEKGQTKLELYDATGSAVLTIIDENINKPGQRNFNENLESIPSGAYSIILTTPTFRQVKNLIIQR